jgi:hypothetical protein
MCYRIVGDRREEPATAQAADGMAVATELGKLGGRSLTGLTLHAHLSAKTEGADMLKKLVLGTVLGGVVFVTAAALAAGSKCDSGVSKAVGKQVSCRCTVIAKGQAKALAPDATKLAGCDSKFLASCGKAKAKNDCVVQTGTCAAKGAEGDTASGTLCLASPSGAFLD